MHLGTTTHLYNKVDFSRQRLLMAIHHCLWASRGYNKYAGVLLWLRSAKSS